jgi:hypothetical protein
VQGNSVQSNTELRDFLRSRRARITPEEAGPGSASGQALRLLASWVNDQGPVPT